jgi:hypothetical protein
LAQLARQQRSTSTSAPPGAHLELWQQGNQLVLGHGPEVGALQREATLGEDTTLAGDVAGSVDVVAGDHAHHDASLLAGNHGVGHLGEARVGGAKVSE